MDVLSSFGDISEDVSVCRLLYVWFHCRHISDIYVQHFLQLTEISVMI
jgi:hypothetical protein